MSSEINFQNQIEEYFEEVDQIYEAYAKANGLTYITLTVLEAIYEMPDGCTQKQIVAATHYPKQTINLAIKSFLEDGYVELKETSVDRRNKSVLLTEKGKVYAKRIAAPLVAAEAAAMNGLGKEKSEMLLCLLKEYCNLYCSEVDKI